MSTKTSEANPRPIEKLVHAAPPTPRRDEKSEEEERDADTARWSDHPCTD
jgi:hypothetical protein